MTNKEPAVRWVSSGKAALKGAQVDPETTQRVKVQFRIQGSVVTHSYSAIMNE